MANLCPISLIYIIITTRSAYKTLYRVHTIEEALAYEIPKDPADLFLYYIDTYDVLSLQTNYQCVHQDSVLSLLPILQ